MTTMVNIPGYLTGSWAIDATQSDVSFQARQFGVSKVRGTFDDVEGTIVTADDPLHSSVNAVIRTASVDTGNERRDKHLRTDDFLGVEEFPTMTFTSTGVRFEDGTFLIDGDLTIRSVTRQVTLTVAPSGFDAGSGGKRLAGFTATAEINRKDFGVTGGASGAVVSAKIQIALEIKAGSRD